MWCQLVYVYDWYIIYACWFINYSWKETWTEYLFISISSWKQADDNIPSIPTVCPAIFIKQQDQVTPRLSGPALAFPPARPRLADDLAKLHDHFPAEGYMCFLRWLTFHFLQIISFKFSHLYACLHGLWPQPEFITYWIVFLFCLRDARIRFHLLFFYFTFSSLCRPSPWIELNLSPLTLFSLSP